MNFITETIKTHYSLQEQEPTQSSWKNIKVEDWLVMIRLVKFAKKILKT